MQADERPAGRGRRSQERGWGPGVREPLPACFAAQPPRLPRQVSRAGRCGSSALRPVASPHWCWGPQRRGRRGPGNDSVSGSSLSDSRRDPVNLLSPHGSRRRNPARASPPVSTSALLAALRSHRAGRSAQRPPPQDGAAPALCSSDPCSRTFCPARPGPGSSASPPPPPSQVAAAGCGGGSRGGRSQPEVPLSAPRPCPFSCSLCPLSPPSGEHVSCGPGAGSQFSHIPG